MTILYLVTLGITFLKALILCRKYLISAQNYLLIYLGITFGVEVYGYYKSQIKEFDFAFLFNYYSIFSIVFFYFYFSRILSKKLKKTTLYIFLISISLIFFYSDLLSSNYDNRLGILSVINFIIYILFWFYQKIQSTNEAKITNDPHFWISAGLLLWSMFFIFRVIPMYLFNEMDKNFLQLLKTILNLVNIVTYTFYFIGLLKFEKQQEING
jgi:hypothetical protein